MDGYPRFRRRNYFVKKGLQGAFVVLFTVIALAGIGANLLLAYFLIDRELAGSLYRAHLKMETTSEAVLPVLLKLGFITVPVIVVASGVLAYFLIRRLEIPLRSLVSAMRELGAGDFALKRGFEGVPDLHGVFLKTTDSLGRVFRSIKAAADGLDKGFERLSLLAGEERLAREEVVAALRDISKKRALAAAEISRFKV